MASLTKGTSFVDGVTGNVTAAKLHALVDAATPVAGFVTDRTAKTSVIGTDLLLISDSADSNNLKKVTVTNMANSLPTAVVTTGTIATLTAGTTTGTAATFSGDLTIADKIIHSGDTNTAIRFPAADTVTVETSGTERLRINSSGHLIVGKSSTDLAIAGASVQSDGLIVSTRDGDQCFIANRTTDDGVLISLRQAGTQEGTISVSGATVSYNAFAGSHWSQLEDGSKQEILRGTVIESIDQLCEWPNEENERLPRCKISNTVASKKVYGVFLDWDNDWTETNDLYVTSLGAFVCRINPNVSVQIGDLLESSGDGTARVQADDIIRSSTIGKVTSTVKTHEHPDGSYCVPTVLYCG